MAVIAAGPIRAERPVAPKLLPENTLAYIRVADAPELIAKFRETAMGRMLRDEQIAPLVEQLYGSVREQFAQIEDRVGLPLDQILKIPQGEICFAVIPQQGGNPPALLLLIDVKDQIINVNKLLEKGEALILENGGSKETEVIADVKITIYTGQGGVSIAQFEKDGTVVITSAKELVKPLLAAWSGNTEEKSLSENAKFNSIMSRCGGSKEERPQITFYVDPIEIARKVIRGPAAIGLAFIPVLGLDGVKGLGGSVIFGAGEFDEVTHFHLLLDNPRSGIVELLAMGAGDTTPEAWVPNDVASYTTLHWRVEEMYKNGNKLWDSLQGEGNFKAFLKERLSDNVGVDVETEIIPALDGRITYTQWIEKPVRLNSQTNIVGIKLKDAKAFQAVIDKLIAKFPDNLEKQAFGGVTYWSVKGPEQPEGAPQPRTRPRILFGAPQGENLRQPTPAFAILGDYLILTDSTLALQHCITTTSDATRSLASDLEYKLIAGKIKRQVGGESPGMIQFSRPEEGLRFLYDLARAEQTQKGLESAADNNPFLKNVSKAMKDNPLPPFSVLAKYFAPGGGMMVNDETGYHYMTFTLKRKNQ